MDQIAEAVHIEAPIELLQVRAADIATHWAYFQAPLGSNRDELEQGRLTGCCRTIGYHREEATQRSALGNRITCEPGVTLIFGSH